MARLSSLSGFPEFLPGDRLVEQHVIALLGDTFQRHGFGSIETRSVEPMSVLGGKGEIDKEIYAVRRWQGADSGSDADWGLHFDLTVPLARYVVEQAGHLSFPFRRYQIQKVWRGERPQEGRFREFTQADVDIIGADTLADHHDIEVVAVAAQAWHRLQTELSFPAAKIRVNNRKLSEGFYRGLGITEPGAVLQRIDKLGKIGPERVSELLIAECGLEPGQASRCVELASIESEDASFDERVRALGVKHDLLDEGIELLRQVLDAGQRIAPGVVRADLSIARGLDYYTGSVFETELVGYERLGSVASGGRYDELARDNKRVYPGVGYSLGVTRMLVPLLGQGHLRPTRAVSSCVLVAVDAEDSRDQALAVATALRARGIPAELAPNADRFGKQIRYADRRAIPFVWFCQADGDQVKDLRSGDQVPASADTWTPPETDLLPQISAS